MNTILALVDFSDVTDAVVEQAASMAKGLEAEVVILHVAEPDPDFVGYEAGPQTVRNTMAEHFRDEHRSLRHLEDKVKAQGVAVTGLLVQGPTVEKCLAEAARLQPLVMVIGSHGHGLLRDLLVGSVTEGVLRKAACPVLVVPVRAWE
ncbi:MAG TPA: universal stress protein [Kiritimatiellia bacterium]|nr:universal stress protein [Kiritimatiellia bacterium]HRZ11956.1 universal stress protein [Kiritimatiellia bacterium]HSA17238.1 universal stress protein [Kiritimatiellia bacterium]